jgi:hypothetical protein
VETAGEQLFHLACMRDLEGIVAKRKFDPYLPNGETSWLKIRNRDYSQWVGREELFEKERDSNPDLLGWDPAQKSTRVAGGSVSRCRDIYSGAICKPPFRSTYQSHNKYGLMIKTQFQSAPRHNASLPIYHALPHALDGFGSP